MLVQELIAHLEKMDENSTVKLQITTKFEVDEESLTLAPIETIEFGNGSVILKGDDELIEWN